MTINVKNSSALLIAAIFAASAGAPLALSREAIHAAALNDGLAAFAQEYIGEHAEFASLQLWFSDPPFSSYDDYQLRLDFKAQLEQSAWAPTPTAITGYLEHQDFPVVAKDGTSVGGSARVVGKVEIDTDVVALANHILKIAKGRFCEYRHHLESDHVDTVFLGLWCPEAASVEEFADFGEALDFVMLTRTIHQQATSKVIRNLQRQATDAADAAHRTQINTVIAQHRHVLERLNSSSELPVFYRDGAATIGMRFNFPTNGLITVNTLAPFTGKMHFDNGMFLISTTGIKFSFATTRRENMGAYRLLGMQGALRRGLIGLQKRDKEEFLFLLGGFSPLLENIQGFLLDR